MTGIPTTFNWTSRDPRDSALFPSSYALTYRFITEDNCGETITTILKGIRNNKEDRIARLEWSGGDGWGRAVMGRLSMPMADMMRREGYGEWDRLFTGPDGYIYMWTSSGNGELELMDPTGTVIAYYRKVKSTLRYMGQEVCGELHIVPKDGGVVLHPPLMDMIVITAMLYRFSVVHGVLR